MERRDFLRGLGLAAGLLALPEGASARDRKKPLPDALGLLYDSTRCIGCKACQSACRVANDLLPDPGLHPDGMYHAPRRLSARAKTVIFETVGEGRRSFYKAQCMHCIDPACVSVCMLGALHKIQGGVVAYDKDRCVGCRYCQIACPFDVPRFEWDSATPLIVKCELCRHRLDQGMQPACSAVCPRRAVIFGKRTDLLADARDRIARLPDRYEPRVYGEIDGGGTQVLALAPKNVPFERFGLPDLGDAPVPELSETVQHGIYRGFVAPAALYAVLGVTLWRNRKRGEENEPAEADREERR